jgi:hypothetical protein
MSTSLSPAGVALGLGDLLGQQVAGETEESARSGWPADRKADARPCRFAGGDVAARSERRAAVATTDPTVKAIESNLAFDLRASWQARALAETGGHMAPCCCRCWRTISTMPCPSCCASPIPASPRLPRRFIAPRASSPRSGQIVADVVTTDGQIVKDAKVFDSEIQMRDAFRRLADRMKLSDSDRVEMFKCVQRWVVADRRLDPNFDPKDPDAKRLH